jgi:hypothetical protein
MRIRTGNGMRLILTAAVVTVVALSQVGAWATTCNPTYVTQAGNLFTVLPTGADDTANIQCALNEATALGAGSTVQLACGTYFTGLVEVTGFAGTFKGAGKDLTIIHSVPNLPCGEAESAGFPSLFKFRLCHARVADLTFDINDPLPCQPWSWGQMLGDILYVTDLPSNLTECVGLPTPLSADMTVERVGFKGMGNWTDGYNANVGFIVSPECGPGRLAGTFVVTGCTFERLEYGFGAGGLADSTFRAGGSPSLGNTTSDIRQALYFADFDNSAVEISYNDIGAMWANIQGYQGNALWPTASSTFLVSHNTIRADGSADGIFLADWTSPETGKMLVAEISHNEFLMNNGWCCQAVNGWWNTRDVLVRNNRFTGVANIGVATGFVRWGTDTGWTLVGNNFEGLDALPVYLGRYSSGCTVVGGHNKLNVIDQGTGNVLTGVNNMNGDPPGPDLSEALQNKIGKMKFHK